MKPNVHYDAAKTSAQIPSHTARRILYAHSAVSGSIIREFDVPSAYPRALSGKNYPVYMKNNLKDQMHSSRRSTNRS